MKELWNNAKRFFGNRWVKFGIVSVIYILWFVVWSRCPWMLLGLPVIYDIYITKFISRTLFTGHKRRRRENKAYREVWGWIDAIIFAAIVIPIISIYFFQNFKIPSSSMEKTLLVGDHLCVSKLAYGPRMPNTPIAMPFVHNAMPLSNGMRKSYSEAIKLPYKRIAGFGTVQRGDIVVFNFPAGDTVILERINETFYDIVRNLEPQYGARTRDMLAKEYTIRARPVDRREHYVKRCVAIPGDTLTVVNGVVHIDGVAETVRPGMEHNYLVRTTGTPIPRSAFEKMGLSKEDYYQDGHLYLLNLTEENRTKIEAMKNVESVERQVYDNFDRNIFPHDFALFPWTLDNFGPLWIPKKGTTVELTADNLPLYERIIRNYEGNSLEIRDGAIYINGSPAQSYTFGMDYYFMMGDNRHGSLDSRYWGFVPEDHVAGKPAFIFWARDRDTGKILWNRLFSNPK